MAWISERAPWLTQLDWRGWVEFTIVVGTALIALLNGTWRRYGEPWWDGQSLKRTEKAAFQIVQKYNVAKRCLENPAVAIAQFSQIICAIIIGAAGMVMAATVAMNWVIGHEGSSYTVDTLHIVIIPALLLAYLIFGLMILRISQRRRASSVLINSGIDRQAFEDELEPILARSGGTSEEKASIRGRVLKAYGEVSQLP